MILIEETIKHKKVMNTTSVYIILYSIIFYPAYMIEDVKDIYIHSIQTHKKRSALTIQKTHIRLVIPTKLP